MRAQRENANGGDDVNGTRERYLEAMGIQAWERRVDLPGLRPESAQVPDMPQAEPPPVVAEAQPPVSPPEPRLPESAETRSVASLDWSELKARVAECTLCELHAGRTQTVFGVGAHDADWMIIGEGPGAEEDRQGEPFVGRAGKLLNNMLRALGLRREAVYIANIVKCRPPGNRDPKPEEAAACRPYLERQIALVKPRLILAVGRIAAQNLLDTDVAVGKLRGRAHRYGDAGIPLVVTYHPAYLLRSPEQKARAWDDLCLARALLEEEA
ncbi:MAG: uracil-DNA glycosylase [Acidihalobacter sp.]|jgi:uracil-DNA glycosylase|uniref:uracil-DNA glycosylase n=1 Tax=Acidihalobacter sp. TaxID=1872108 RepID=UPI00307E79E2